MIGLQRFFVGREGRRVGFRYVSFGGEGGEVVVSGRGDVRGGVFGGRGRVGRVGG